MVVDEAHERSLHSDVVLGLLKKIRRKRPDIKLIVTSATINALEMQAFFNTGTPNGNDVPDACIVAIPGKMYPVDILYATAPVQNYIRETVNTILSIHKSEGSGDILAFLPGAEEIDTALDMLRDLHDKPDLVCLPLYGSLPAASQMLIFKRAPQHTRKVVIATNIAETSLTIDGIRFVIDAGFVKLNFFDVSSGIDSLVTCPISQASARQRSGRAGRTQSGKCFRLYTEVDYNKLEVFTIPDMRRSDISWVMLELKALGIADVLHFDFMSPPSSDAMIHALELLHSLGAIDMNCDLTPLGVKMAEMPVEPRLSRCLLASFEYGCVQEMLSIAAMCDVEFPFVTVRHRAGEEAKQRLIECISQFASLDGDHVSLLSVFNGFASSGYDSSWCDQYMLSYKRLSRAKEV